MGALKTNEQLRQQIQADVDAYLARGGKIEQVDSSANRDADLRYITPEDRPHRQIATGKKPLWSPVSNAKANR